MAANEITFKVKVTKDGSLKVVAKDADKAAKGTEKLGKATDETTKARNRYSRGEKGVAEAGMNSTKSFSKMRDVMGGGSSGLVGAYATLAANVFALTAAFGILQRASAAQQLAEGLEFTGTVAGRNLPYIADQLKAITGAAVSTQEAMSAVALATSSGFSSSQISQLGEVAKGASLALGRDMTDALNRLVRGAAKLEPELLDELGIMVRLDDATRAYANELGTVEGNLTQYQKRQAFVNAIIKEGQNSFSGIAAAIEPNVYDQLSAALSDLLKDFVTLLNNGLKPVVKLFSKSPAALVGGVLLFASTIRGQLLPGLTQGAQRMANFAAESKAAAQASFANVSTTGALPKVYTELASKIQNGTATTEDFNKAQNSLNNSMAKHNRDLENNSALQDTNTKKGAEKAAKIDQVTTAQAKLNNITVLGAKADTAAAKATAINSAAQLQFGGTIRGIRAAMAAYKLEITATAIANGAATASFAGLRVALFGAATGFAALATGILTLMPFLALIPVVIGLGKVAFDKFFGDSGTSSKIEDINKSLDHLTEVSGQLNLTLEQIELRGAPDAEYQKFLATLTAASGAAAQIRDRTSEVVTVQLTAKQDRLNELLREEQDIRKKMAGEKFTVLGERSLQSRLDSTTAKITQLKDGFNQIEVGPVIDNLEIAVGLLGKTDEDNKIKEAYQTRIEQLKKITVEGTAAASAVLDILAPKTIPEGTNELMQSLNGDLTKFSEGVNKLREKVSTPFDEMSKSLDSALKSLTQNVKGTETLTDASANLAKAMKDPNSSLSKAMENFGIEGEKVSQQTLTRLNTKLKDGIKILQEGPGEIKKQEAELVRLAKTRDVSVSNTKIALSIEDSILDTKQTMLQTEKDLLGVLKVEEPQNARILEINAELEAIGARRTDIAEDNLEIVKAQVGFQKLNIAMEQKSLDALKSNISARETLLKQRAQEAAFADPTRRNTRLTAKEERAIQKDLQKSRKTAIEAEFKIKKAQVDMEFAVIEARFRLLEAQAINSEADRKAIEAYGNLIAKAKRDSKNALTNAEALALRTNNSTLGLDAQAVGEQQAAAKVGDSVAERIRNAFSDEVDVFNEQTLSEQIGIINSTVEPMIETFKKLGPGGELSALVVQGAFAVSTAWVDAFTTIGDIFHQTNLGLNQLGLSASETWKMMSGENQKEVMSAAFGAASSSISALQGVYAAASANRIAGIDAEIAAEKKRDGTSQKSLAKIASLEKKKEQQKKKAFEVNKALMLANAIMSTAAGVAGALSLAGKVPPGVETALAVMIGAMGAAQIAIISGMSYQGGSGGNTKPTPKSVAVGNRRDSVDLSTSQSARGELSYMRGDRGVGGPENFRPAFYGKKNRNMGGSTGYVVGEQGPELFMPDRPGTIVPADDTAQVGGATNVTFSINAIDASGVEDVLAEQQGNIIGMIRNAANSYGEDFLEDLDESTYTSPIARRA